MLAPAFRLEGCAVCVDDAGQDGMTGAVIPPASFFNINILCLLAYIY
jgi:hypothetical protein